jgi:hypothetical protein
MAIPMLRSKLFVSSTLSGMNLAARRFLATPAPKEMKSLSERIIEVEEKYSAHNYHPIPGRIFGFLQKSK